MKINVCFLLFLIFIEMPISPFAQLNGIVVKAWAIEETMMGGAAPPEMEKPMNRTTRRFFLETKPGAKVKVTAVWIGKTPYSVFEETYNIQAPDKDYRPVDLVSTKNKFTQVMATDTLKADCGKKVPNQLLGNEAVIEFLMNGKKYYAAIKTIEHTQINLP